MADFKFTSGDIYEQENRMYRHKIYIQENILNLFRKHRTNSLQLSVNDENHINVTSLHDNFASVIHTIRDQDDLTIGEIHDLLSSAKGYAITYPIKDVLSISLSTPPPLPSSKPTVDQTCEHTASSSSPPPFKFFCSVHGECNHNSSDCRAAKKGLSIKAAFRQLTAQKDSSPLVFSSQTVSSSSELIPSIAWNQDDSESSESILDKAENQEGEVCPSESEKSNEYVSTKSSNKRQRKTNSKSSLTHQKVHNIESLIIKNDLDGVKNLIEKYSVKCTISSRNIRKFIEKTIIHNHRAILEFLCFNYPIDLSQINEFIDIAHSHKSDDVRLYLQSLKDEMSSSSEDEFDIESENESPSSGEEFVINSESNTSSSDEEEEFHVEDEDSPANHDTLPNIPSDILHSITVLINGGKINSITHIFDQYTIPDDSVWQFMERSIKQNKRTILTFLLSKYYITIEEIDELTKLALQKPYTDPTVGYLTRLKYQQMSLPSPPPLDNSDSDNDDIDLVLSSDDEL